MIGRTNRTNEYRPDYVSPPGATLEETLDAIGMTQADLSERIGRPKKTVNEIIKGKSPITPETALRLERVLGIPASFWNNRERAYRDSLARLEEKERLEEHVQWLDSLPMSALLEMGWIPKCDNKVSQVRACLNFFGVASPDLWRTLWLENPQIAFRRSAVFESDPGAVAAWLRRGELEAQEIDCAPFDEAGFKEALRAARKLTTRPPEEFVPELVRWCATTGVAVVFVPGLPKIRSWGATRWLTPNKALIQLSLRYKTDDHLWFSFFHEAGHILLHGKKEIFLEDEDGEDRKEQEANDFAANLLIPPADYRRLVQMKPRSKEVVRTFAAEIGIASGIVVGRLQHEGQLPRSHCNELKMRLEWAK